jgi:hypothetical protein
MGHANGDVPASGRSPLSTLDEVIGNFGVSSAGKITLSDYFEPYEYVSMDAGDSLQRNWGLEDCSFDREEWQGLHRECEQPWRIQAGFWR